MARRITDTKDSIIKQIIEIDVQLCSGDLTPEERRKLQTKRDRLERRLYH